MRTLLVTNLILVQLNEVLPKVLLLCTVVVVAQCN